MKNIDYAPHWYQLPVCMYVLLYVHIAYMYQ